MAWNVVHNFPGAKDTYEVPVDYPTVGYDTIIASWFTDVFTSILAMQDSLLDLVGKVLLLAGGTMTGNLTISAEEPLFKLLTVPDGVVAFKFYKDAVELFLIEHNTEEGELRCLVGDFLIGVSGGNLLFDAGEVHVIASDIELLDKTKGLILKSPNNSRFRLEVSDGGVLSTEAL